MVTIAGIIACWFAAMRTDPFGWCCYAALAVPTVASLLGTADKWSRKELGPDRLPDPTTAALFGHAAWFAFGWIEDSREAFWVNLACGIAQIINLGAYLKLCTKAERLGVAKRVLAGGAFLFITVAIGLPRDTVELFKVFCSVSGLAGASMPMLVAVFATDYFDRTTDRLPSWFVLVANIVNGMAWFARGLHIENMPMAAMNCAGAVAFLWLLVLRFLWDAPQTNYRRPLIARGKAPEHEETESDSDQSNHATDGAGKGKQNEQQTGSSSEHKEDAIDLEKEAAVGSEKGKEIQQPTGSPSDHKEDAIDLEKEAAVGSEKGKEIQQPTGPSSAHEDSANDLNNETGGNGSKSPAAPKDSANDLNNETGGNGSKSQAAPKDSTDDLKNEADGNGSASPAAHENISIKAKKKAGGMDAVIDIDKPFIIEIKMEAGGNSGAPNETSPASPNTATAEKSDPPAPPNTD